MASRDSFSCFFWCRIVNLSLNIVVHDYRLRLSRYICVTLIILQSPSTQFTRSVGRQLSFSTLFLFFVAIWSDNRSIWKSR